MSDWQVGDKALCVKLGQWRGTMTGRLLIGPAPKPGCLYTVSWAGPSRSTGSASLEFAEIATPRTRKGLPTPWRASRFIKLNGYAPDEQDDITIALLTGKPVEVTV